VEKKTGTRSLLGQREEINRILPIRYRRIFYKGCEFLCGYSIFFYRWGFVKILLLVFCSVGRY